MKKEGLYFFSNLFGSSGGKKTEAESTEKEIIVTSYSQPHVLQEKMIEEKMTHGEVVMANISPVRLEGARHNMIIYFCPMEKLDVVAKIKSGDGKDIPREATVEGLKVPTDLKPGLYALKNVKITSNGTMQVLATAETTWERMSVTRGL
jgi:hypothetical protein